MNNLYNINNWLLIGQGFKKTIEQWDEKLDAFTKTYMDSPWAGTIIFIVLLAFSFMAIGGYMRKR